MSETEIQLGRLLGASAFFIYQTLRTTPEASMIELEQSTNLSLKTVRAHLKSLIELNVVTKREVFEEARECFVYTSNEDLNSWRLQ